MERTRLGEHRESRAAPGCVDAMRGGGPRDSPPLFQGLPLLRSRDGTPAMSLAGFGIPACQIESARWCEHGQPGGSSRTGTDF